MKVFWISIILLAVMLSGIAWNYSYINNVANEMISMLDALPDAEDEASPTAAREIVDFWETRADYVALSVSYTVTDRVSEQAVTLAACAACGDRYGYRTAVRHFCDFDDAEHRGKRYHYCAFCKHSYL